MKKPIAILLAMVMILGLSACGEGSRETDASETTGASQVTVPTENWKDMVAPALTAYAADPSEENWAGVVKNFVDGWAAEYAALD